MRNWKDADWDQERPSLEQMVASWTSLDWEASPISSAPVGEYLAQVRATHVNGGAVIGRWKATRCSDEAAWFLSRNRFDEYELHRLFFEHPTVRRDLATLQIPERLERSTAQQRDLGVAGLRHSDILTLDGLLAGILVGGGAYERFRGSAAEAKDLGDAVVRDLTGRRYEDFRLATSHAPWTPWFFDVAWDYTFTLTDVANAEMVVLCITDTD